MLRHLVSLAVLLLAGSNMQAGVRVIASPSPSVSLVSFGTTEFEEVARRLGVVNNPLLPFCVVISNRRDQPITALAVQYSFAGAKRTEVENIVSDGFNLPSRPLVVAPKSQAIVGPGMVISSATSPSGRALRSTAFVDETLSRLNVIKDIEVSLDSALFADGILVGPDKSQAIHSIVVRQQVAAQVGSATKAMIDKGESPTTWLKSLAGQPGGSALNPDWVRLWQSNYSSMLLRALERGNARAVADQLSQATQIDLVR